MTCLNSQITWKAYELPERVKYMGFFSVQLNDPVNRSNRLTFQCDNFSKVADILQCNKQVGFGLGHYCNLHIIA